MNTWHISHAWKHGLNWGKSKALKEWIISYILRIIHSSVVSMYLWTYQPGHGSFISNEIIIVSHEERSHLRLQYHDDAIRWKHFPRYWHFVRGISDRWISLTKAGDEELWCFLWSAPWMNGWVNNSEADDLRSHRVHCNVNVMIEQW